MSMFRNVTSKDFILNLHGSFPHSFSFSALKKFATVDPFTLAAAKPYRIQNRVNGIWKDALTNIKIVDPMNGEEYLECPNTNTKAEIDEYIESMKQCPKSGLHNPLKHVERYNHYGQVCQRAASLLYDQEVYDFFVKLIQRVMPKSIVQAKGELTVVRKFLENFSGDQIRFLCRSFNVSGDHLGQQSTGYRWPYGPVCIIAPFNFPIEIPALQMMGALFCGNKVLIKADSKVSLVLEQFLRMLLFCGLPPIDVDLIHTDGPNMENILLNSNVRLTQFTGSSHIANRLAEKLKGKVRLEDAGFDWKILGPDVQDFEYVAWTCDQDAYAISGQKCSAQSILFAHENWVQKGLFDKIKELASRRKLDDLTSVPILTWNNERINQHVQNCLAIPGAKLLFGGKELTGHKIPTIYGAYEPTAIYVPLKEILDPKYNKIVTTELFGPFQIVTSYNDEEVATVLEILERIDHHLTAAVVSNDITFLQHILSHTVNGTTYSGIRARTTGAPQNHWFGPAGDPRGAGIGSPEAILSVWSCHREIINDYGPINKGWTIPDAS